jgi:hypothetical protein
MDVDAAARLCQAAGHRLDAARAELVAVGDIEWTGHAAGAYAASLEESLRAISLLRTEADHVLQAVQRHASAVHGISGACP